jgi:class 3 adenylate cyclase
MLRARVDRHRCIGAGNCITLAPTAFGWHGDDLFKVEVLESDSVEEEQLRIAAFSCPTAAIELEEVDELLPWQLRGKVAPSRRVVKTFMFTDIVGSTALVEAIGDEAWTDLLRWHDEMLRALFSAHRGKEIDATGDGFFVGFDSPEDALACATAMQRRLAEHRRQHGFAPQVRIGVHASEAAQEGTKFRGMGVHEAARIGALAQAGEIVASKETLAGTASFQMSEPRTVTLKGLSEPIDVVTVEWH